MKKPRLHFWQIWNMSFGFLGIQFGLALQNANVSRIFETLGAETSQIPILWIAAPVSGLIVQPIVGYLSDNTWNRFGRRRPYFLIGAIIASIALIFMPNSPALWVAAGMLWIMDASINITMEPFRAFVGDMLPSEQRTKGFAMQSFFIGTAAFVGSFLPWIMTNVFLISNTAPDGMIPDSVKYSFYVGGIIFFSAVMWTIVKTKEYSPEQLKAFEEAEHKASTKPKIEPQQIDHEKRAKTKLTQGPIFLLAGAGLSLLFYTMGWALELYILSVGLLAFGIWQVAAGILQTKGIRENGVVIILDDLYSMPKTMQQMSVVQFFSWFALFTMWIYATPAVTSHIYDMKMDQATVGGLVMVAEELEANPEATWAPRLPAIQQDLQHYQDQFAAGATEVVASMRVVTFFLEDRGVVVPAQVRSRMLEIQREYSNGADWVGVAFAAYNGFAALIAFFLPVLARWTNRRTTHAIALLCGSAGLISIYFVSHPYMLIASMVGVGIAWASILAMPYAILAGSLPAKKMGIFMGIFNFFIVLPQILAASILGFLTATLFGGQAILALVLGGITWILAAGLVMLVDDVDEVEARAQQLKTV